MDFLLIFLLANKLYSCVIFTLGFIFGYSFAKLRQKPCITALKSQCDAPKTIMHLGFVSIGKIYRDEKLKDINCRFKTSKSICEETGKKCKFMK